MKIVCYTYDDTKNPWCGGGGAFRIETVHELLAARGHDVEFICGNYPSAKAEGRIIKKFVGLKTSYLLSRISYTFIANIHALFSRADIVLTEFSVYAPVFNFLFRKNVILEFYHLLGKRTIDKYGVFGVLPFIFEKIMVARSKVIITMAPGTKEAVLKLCSEKEVHALPCGFDEKQLELAPVNEKYILVFGRIDIYMKGIDRLIPVMQKVLAEFHDYRLVFAGRGSDEDIKTLNRLIDENNLRSNTDVIINPEYDRKLELFRKCTYVAIFSRFEGWCIVAIEAAAAGKAILGVDVEGLRDSVNNGFNGILVENFDENRLVLEGKKLLADESYREMFEKNARIHASQFKWEKIAEMQEAIYIKTIEKCGRKN